VAKGVNGPIAAFEEVCPQMLKVNTPGVTSADMSHFTFHARPVPLYPFEDVAKPNWAKALGLDGPPR
jgi:microcystin degradation protein MlrC